MKVFKIIGCHLDEYLLDLKSSCHTDIAAGIVKRKMDKTL
jgi:hypothetical protein